MKLLLAAVPAFRLAVKEQCGVAAGQVRFDAGMRTRPCKSMSASALSWC